MSNANICGRFQCSKIPLKFMRHCTAYKLSALQIRISGEHTPNPTTQQFITVKVSGCALKQRSKTHSALRQSNLQVQNEAALMSRRIGAIEHRKCAAGLSGAHPSLQDRILLNYTRIKNALKVLRKTFNFSLCLEVQHTFSFLFPCWDIIKCLNASMLKSAVFELVQQFYHATEIDNVAKTVSARADQP